MLDYPDLRYFRFVLIRTSTGGEWIVFLDRHDERRIWGVSQHKGCGATPELAYMNLLEKTADKLAVFYSLQY
jgi:hypothetical protein